MNIQTFRGADLKQVSRAAQLALGEDAMIVRTRVLPGRPMPLVEVVAVRAAEVSRFRKRIEPPLLQPPAPGSSRRNRPLVVALVGPTGAGKSTTLAKLAINPAAFGTWRVGLVTVDTFRAGAVDQLASYASVGGIPLEVVYAPEEAEGALRRLSACDVVLIDSPGRSPRFAEQNANWMATLSALRPDEVHLVVPIPLRLEVAFAALEAYEGLGITHLLLTKLDEVSDDAGVADAAVEFRLPARWVTDGQEIPSDLHPAVPRILGSLGGYTGGVRKVRISA